MLSQMKPNTRNTAAFMACLLMLFAFPPNAFSATHHVTTCGTVITTSGLWLLDNDLTCSGNAIDVQVSNVTLKLQGHTLTGPGTTVNAYGILAATSIGSSEERNHSRTGQDHRLPRGSEF